MRAGRLWQILSLLKQRNRRGHPQRAIRFVEGLEPRTLLASPSMVADINPGSGSSSPTDIVAIGDTIYFGASDGEHGMELWKSDGTTAGTVMVKDINPGQAGSSISNLVAYHGQLYFAADDGEHGIELWKSDGTAAGTTMVADVYDGALSGFPQNLTVMEGGLYFSATVCSESNTALYKTDGTAAGTKLVKDFASLGSAFLWRASPVQLTPCGGKLFFVVGGFAPNGTPLDDLFVTDGTPAGTREVTINQYGMSVPRYLTDLNGTLYLTAQGQEYNVELWRVDSDTLQATGVDINGVPNDSSEPADLAIAGDTLFFTVKSAEPFKRELWKYTVAGGPSRVINPLTCSPRSGTLVGVDGTLFFAGSGDGGIELWKSDGTASGTVRIRDIAPGTLFSNPVNLTDVGGWLLFTAVGDGLSDRELWYSLGTAETTQRIADINPGGDGSWPTLLQYVNGTVFFSANDGTHGIELWKLSYGNIRLYASANALELGQTVTLTAAVENASASADTPIVFWDGERVLASIIPDANGQASFSTNSLPIGEHDITASWDGESVSPRLLSSVQNLTVSRFATSVALSTPPGPATAGRPMTFTATVSAKTGEPSGTITFMDGANAIGSAAVGADGRASITLSSLPAGIHTLWAAYGGSDSWAEAQSAPTAFDVTRTRSVMSLTSPQSLFLIDEYPTVELKVSASNTSLVPTGQVYFSDESNYLAAFSLDVNGECIYYVDLPIGLHTLTASYTGDPYFGPVVQSIQLEGRRFQTLTILRVSSENRSYGDSIMLTASVANEDRPSFLPAGVVRFRDTSTNVVLGEAPFIGGSAALTIQSLGTGLHTIVAEYIGDSKHAASQSTPLSLTVSALSTTTTLTSARSSAFGRVYVLTANVSSPSSMVPDGTVVFQDRKTTLGSAILKNGVAELPLSGLARGSHVFTVTYSGSANFIASVSAAAAHSVLSNSSVRLSASAKYATTGQPITLTAALSPRASRKLAPSGKIFFYCDSVLLGRGRITNNGAQITTRKLAPGWHTITASYSGDANFIPSASAPATTVIAYPTIVDLMVVYTPAALASVGGQYMMNQTIRQAVRDTNQAFINSKVPVTMRVVRASQVQYTESGDYDTDLTRMRWPGDGYLDEVPALRNKYGADLVSLFAAPPNDDTLGIGYQLLDTGTRGNDARGYSVVAAQYAAAPDYVLAHELGHNLSASHDIEQNDSEGAPADSHGYRFTAGGTLYHDIMSYDPGVVIPYFSNPQVNYLGVPTGTTSYANSARVITAASSYVAAYRPTKLSLKSTVMLLN